MKKVLTTLLEITFGVVSIPIALIFGILFLLHGIFSWYEIMHNAMWEKE